MIVEVRDARIPFTSINKEFECLWGDRPRLIVYNKADLANPNMKKPVIEAIEALSPIGSRKTPVLFTNALKDVNPILQFARGWLLIY